MDLALFWKGLLIGLAIAAPVGPIGLLCIRRTLVEGRLAGFVTGMGAATADACYGAIAALGLHAVSSRLVAQESAIRLVGGLFLCYLGVRTLLGAVATESAAGRGRSLLTVYLWSFLLTMTNPTTILSFVAVFAGLGLVEAAENRIGSLAIVVGVFLGSAAWWLFLSNAVGLFRRALTPDRRVWINRVSGAILVGFGVVAVASLV